MEEYFLTRSGPQGLALRFLFSYGSKEAMKLILRCKHEYNYDIVTMIKEERSGKTTVGPAPIRFIYKMLHHNS